MNQQSLQRAMEEARRLVQEQTAGAGRSASASGPSGGSSPMPPLHAATRNFHDLLRGEPRRGNGPPSDGGGDAGGWWPWWPPPRPQRDLLLKTHFRHFRAGLLQQTAVTRDCLLPYSCAQEGSAPRPRPRSGSPPTEGPRRPSAGRPARPRTRNRIRMKKVPRSYPRSYLGMSVVQLRPSHTAPTALANGPRRHRCGSGRTTAHPPPRRRAPRPRSS